VSQPFRKAGLFVAWTFGISWLLAGAFWALGGRWNTPAAMAVGVAYMFVPMAVAIGVQKLACHEPLREPLGISFRLNRWFLIAWLFPPVLAFAAFGVSLLLPSVQYSPGMEGMFERFASLLSPEELAKMRQQAAEMPIHPVWIGLGMGMLAGATINAVAGFGEELGWRGLLQRELGHLGFWRSSALIGAIWGVWHAPIILQGHNYPQHPVAGVFLMIAFCVLLAPIISYVRLRARSVLAAAILHGTLNGTAGIALLVVKGGSDLLVGVTGLAGLVVLGLADAALFAYDRRAGKGPCAAAATT
jgi:membrane protease YdiL (CAAX protease family)